MKNQKKLKKKKKLSPLAQILSGIVLVILAIGLAFCIYVYAATQPMTAIRNQSIAIAKQTAGLRAAETFNIVTTDETVYAVTGKDNSGKEIGVLIEKGSDKVRVVELSEGVKPASLPQTHAFSIDLGLYKGQPVWEVNTKNGFQIYDFTTGKAVN